MRLTRLEIQNFMGISSFECDFGSAPVICFEGDNNTTKTGHLRAIKALFAGGKAIPDVPIKRGSKKAQIIGETETLICKRTFTAKGERLTVWPNGAGSVKLSSPQAVLNELIGQFLDPFEFDHMARDKRGPVLQKLVGLDLAAFDARRKEYETTRRDIGRDKKTAEGALDSIPLTDPGEPGAMTVSEILAEIDARDQRNDNRNSKRSLLETKRAEADSTIEEIKEVNARVGEIKASQSELATGLATELVGAAETVTSLIEDLEGVRLAGMALAAEVADLTPDEDTAELRASLSTAEAAAEAAAVRAADADRRVDLAAKIGEYARDYDALTAKMTEIDMAKADAIDNAEYPIEGLSIKDGDVWLDGLPWDQANAAKRMISSTAIGLAIHPKLKIVCIEQASLLGDTARKLLHETVAKAGGQAFIEIVTKGKEVEVVFEESEDVEGAQDILLGGVRRCLAESESE